MKSIKAILLVLLVPLLSCKDAFIGSDLPNTYQSNFDVLWNELDNDYPFFEHKNIDWDSLRTEYQFLVDTVSNDSSFFDIMSSLLFRLQDGHVSLTSSREKSQYTGWYEGFPENLNLGRIEIVYLKNLDLSILDAPEPFRYDLLNNKIGYLRIKKFTGSKEDYDEIESILPVFNISPGLIIDVRSNGGGSDINARTVIRHFTDKKRVARLIRYRNGPNHSDFTPLIRDYIEPDESPVKFSKPIVILTNRFVFSAAEDFVLAMRQLPNVKVIGTPTGGGSGNPITKDLPNGWLLKHSRWQVLQPENLELYEGLGLYPDSLVFFTPNDDIFLRDPILDAAIRSILN